MCRRSSGRIPGPSSAIETSAPVGVRRTEISTTPSRPMASRAFRQMTWRTTLIWIGSGRLRS